jgi:ribosomal-protein-alanine N-acetyltransferase
MQPNPQLQSQRFTLIPITDTRACNAHLIEMMQDEKVQRYVNGQAFSDQEVINGLKRFHRINNNNGQGFWLIHDDNQIVVGMCLLKPMPTQQDTGYVETGYWIKPEYWGQGIAAEVATRLVRYAFSELNLERVTAVADERNIPSIKSLLKAGLKQQGKIIAYETELPFFCITKSQYNAIIGK